MVCIVLSVLALGYLAARVSAAICRSDVEPCTHFVRVLSTEVRVNPRGLVRGCKCFKACKAAQEAIGLQNAVAGPSEHERRSRYAIREWVGVCWHRLAR